MIQFGASSEREREGGKFLVWGQLTSRTVCYCSIDLFRGAQFCWLLLIAEVDVVVLVASALFNRRYQRHRQSFALLLPKTCWQFTTINHHPLDPICCYCSSSNCCRCCCNSYSYSVSVLVLVGIHSKVSKTDKLEHISFLIACHQTSPFRSRSPTPPLTTNTRTQPVFNHKPLTTVHTCIKD